MGDCEPLSTCQPRDSVISGFDVTTACSMLCSATDFEKFELRSLKGGSKIRPSTYGKEDEEDFAILGTEKRSWPRIGQFPRAYFRYMHLSYKYVPT